MFVPNLAACAIEVRRRIVLIIEDNPANVKLVEGIFQRRDDLRLVTAVNGAQGIKMAVMDVPDVILMDIKLPDMDGYGVLDILHDNVLTSHVPAIALSSFAHPIDIEKGLKAGFYRYLTKPFKIDELLAAIDSAMLYSQEKSGHAQYVGEMTCVKACEWVSGFQC